MPTTCRTLKVAFRTRVFQHFFSIRRCLTCLSAIDLLGLQSICSPIPVQLLPSAVHLQLCISPLQSICSSPAVHLPVLGGLSSLTVKLKLSTPSTRVLHISSILGFCHSHSSTLHRQLAPSCSDDHLHTPTSYSRG